MKSRLHWRLIEIIWFLLAFMMSACIIMGIVSALTGCTTTTSRTYYELTEQFSTKLPDGTIVGPLKEETTEEGFDFFSGAEGKEFLNLKLLNIGL